MAGRSLNKVMLIGNLTRDPEMRYTPSGTAVTTFGMATNRSWKTDAGEQRDEAEFHRLVAWNKLAELCSQLLSKGRRVYVEGRLQTRTFTGQDNTQRTITEIVLEDMILLDAPPGARRMEESAPPPEPAESAPVAPPAAAATVSSGSDDSKMPKKKKFPSDDVVKIVEPALSENVDASDIPF